MKNKINKIALSAFVAIGLLNSCDTENINPLQVAASEEFGAYARVLTISEDTNANITNVANSSFDVSIEFVDSEGGTLVTDYKLYATFRDQTIADEDDPDSSISTEALVYSFDSSSFTYGDSYPTFDFTVNAEDAIAALGLDLAVAEGGDALNYRGEITLSDGRIFTTTNSGDSINSELFYNDAFSFSSQFVCILDEIPAGDWVIDMHDSYGDGWQTDDANGGSGITVTLSDGSVIEFGLCSPYLASDFDCTVNDGSNGSTTITIPEGITSAVWNFPGDNWSEISFEIYAPSGNLVSASATGASSAGAITINYCQE
ncbi:hypothetical protein [Cellulophaga baltica]|jgi:hypothetical protein|uniref:hypothetical protein n=1 Tax=Cellulophaga baltica TaxID=76594 RepID=UPI0015F3C1E8|nr:hypothetical protein [Cellulophaga baltica]MBA6314277.1 hypothetical protein [Cellulophaga baltica]